MRFRHGNRKLIRIIAMIGAVMSVLMLVSTMSNIIENRILSEMAHAVLILGGIGVVLALVIANVTFSSEKERLNQDRKTA